MSEYAPIGSLDLDLFIEPIEQYTQSNLNVGNGNSFVIDNSGYLEQDFLMTIILKNEFTSGFTITNLITGLSIIIPNPTTTYGDNSIFKIYSDSVYLGDIEINATFIAPFILQENAINILSFVLPTDCYIDVSTVYNKPFGNKILQCYGEGFNLHKAIGLNRINDTFLKKTAKQYIIKTIDLDFSIDKLWVDDYYFILDEEREYRIIYQTDTSDSTIQQQTYCLVGVKFNDLNWAGSSSDIVKEGIKGSAVKLLKI